MDHIAVHLQLILMGFREVQHAEIRWAMQHGSTYVTYTFDSSLYRVYKKTVATNTFEKGEELLEFIEQLLNNNSKR